MDLNRVLDQNHFIAQVITLYTVCSSVSNYMVSHSKCFLHAFHYSRIFKKLIFI